ncbi:zinc metallopeptidase [Clostridium perfringens]|uniref:Neutral zinc metallopeptidase n=1 Tax=Clostridium perfringens F262 TaxID=883064 RepID=A0AAV3FAR5_CLOPF|nr:zinc metallopeptidase [Clostridium perfringens]EIA16592.1 putative neutral zinc metallopeptidase [Clostridium perfringens F262]ELC8366007.1 zinc metallopeptidase [Clostridium perfringens]ELC8394674.1 zinc metallopeptidase [Clostridium perfringens]MBO3342737.1 zinc metallopeptidase [Clostridium perfringens]MBO3345810.1 zinc metallopeptidase [Clostridium perfringens]
MFYPYYIDPTYLILIPAILISAWAQFKVSSTFNKYSTVRSINGYTGAQVARILLNDAGLQEVEIQQVPGRLSDHYDPRAKVLRLSSDVYGSTSVASIGVAAHEVGHAIQDKESYSALVFRNAIVPVVNFSSSLSWILFFIGILLSYSTLVTIGIILFSVVVLFQLVTLPVEFNASSRALKLLEARGILYDKEVDGARKVLSSAALTYVAATLMAVLQLVRLIAISNRNSND